MAASILDRFRQGRHLETARSLYGKAVEQARQPAFYAEWGVPDTPYGRFEMVALHAFLLLLRLRAAGDDTDDLSQQLFDVMFADMDQCLREMGVGDLGVAKRVKRLAQGFYGRMRAYETGLESDDLTILVEALRRNLYGTVTADRTGLEVMAAYVRRESAFLAEQDTDALRAGHVRFGRPPSAAD